MQCWRSGNSVCSLRGSVWLCNGDEECPTASVWVSPKRSFLGIKCAQNREDQNFKQTQKNRRPLPDSSLLLHTSIWRNCVCHRYLGSLGRVFGVLEPLARTHTHTNFALCWLGSARNRINMPCGLMDLQVHMKKLEQTKQPNRTVTTDGRRCCGRNSESYEGRRGGCLSSQ